MFVQGIVANIRIPSFEPLQTTDDRSSQKNVSITPRCNGQFEDLQSSTMSNLTLQLYLVINIDKWSLPMLFVDSHLNKNWALFDVEIIIANRFRSVPLAFPMKFAGDVSPKSGRILDRLLVHFLILQNSNVTSSSNKNNL